MSLFFDTSGNRVIAMGPHVELVDFWRVMVKFLVIFYGKD